jgi:hypothetical protein
MSERRAPWYAGLLALGVSATAPAANFDYQVTAGAAHSDNVTRVADNEQDEDIASAGVRFSFDAESRKTKSDLVGNFDYQKFLDDTYDPQLVGNFTGNLQIAFVPERFNWTFADNFGQVLSDPLLPSTPQNSENINFFSTGPDATLAFGAQNRLKLGARYLRTDYEDSPFDSNTALAEAGFARVLSSVNTLSLNARLQQVNFESSAFESDYDQTDMFVRYEASGARTKISVDAGYSELQRDVGADSRSEMLRVSAIRQLARASSLTLTAGREFANSGSAFAAMQGDGPITLDPTVGRQTPEPFLRDHALLSWMFQKQATTISLRAGIEDQDYEFADALDQKFTTYGVLYRRDLSAVTNVQLDAARMRGEFKLAGARYTDTDAGAALNWGVSRTLTVSLSYRYADRDGDDVTGDYTENRVWLSIAFRHGAPRREPLRPQFNTAAPQN